MKPAWWQTRSFVLLALLASAVPLLYPPIPPLIDLPGHMGRYRVMLGTDAETLSQWYDFKWRPIGNLGVDVLVAILSPAFSLEPTVKAIVVLIPVLTSAGMLWLSLEAHGRIQPLAVAALPLAYNLPFQYGFVNFTLSMALALNALALWLRLSRQENYSLRTRIFVPVAWVIWATHLFGWLVLVLCVFAAETVRTRRADQTWWQTAATAALACVPLALPAMLLLLWQPDGPRAGSDWADTLRFKPGWLVMAATDRWRLVDIATTGLLILLLYRSARSPKSGFDRALIVAAGLLTITFLAMPFGGGYADARLAPYILILALLATRTNPREARTIALIAVALFVARTVTGTVSFVRESQVWSRHLAALDHLPRGARVAVFTATQCDQPWRRMRDTHLASMAIVRRAAFANGQFDLRSTALLTVVAPNVDGYALDPSQIVVDRPCPSAPDYRTLDMALNGLPHRGFDHVWLINTGAVAPALLNGFTPIWSNGSDYLFRIG